MVAEFATDLSEGSEQAFEFALDFARTMNSSLTMLHAIHNVSPTYEGVGILPDVDPYGPEEAKARLATFRAEAERIKIKTDVIVTEDVPAAAILKAEGEQAPDLILMMVQKKGLMERTLLGTTAERVIREAKVPVLSVPLSTGRSPDQLTRTPSDKSVTNA
jgi:nucleotide-binding universal stress UspA family protein